MGTTSSAMFTGSSQFSADFQNVIDRAVAIASLPISQLNHDLTALENQSSDLSGIDSKFAALQAAVTGIGEAMTSAFETDISDPAVVSATVGAGAVEGNYSIQVEDVGAYTSSMTASAWGSQASAPGQTYQLFIGGRKYADLMPEDNSAGSVAAAINAQAGDKVRAVVVNVGSSSAPDYRISLQGTALGDIPLDIRYDGASLQQEQVQGREAKYIVNGSGKTITSNTRAVTVSDGLTLNLLSSDPGHAVNLTVMRSTSGLATGLSAFADAYNAVVDALDRETGQTDGALAGQAIVRELRQSLGDLATYSAAGSAQGGLATLGLDLDKTGKMTFNPFTLMAADIFGSGAVNAFLGSATGGGFLKSATDALNALQDPTTGLIKQQEAALTSQISSTNAQIAAQQDQVNQLQQRLQEQMAAADAAISAMEQQYSYLSSMFQAMRVADQQYQ
jgi:flagellar hook-associated protein 2